MSKLHLEQLWVLLIQVHQFVFSLSASCGAASRFALSSGVVDCSRLMGRVFPLIRLRASGSLSCVP